MKKKVLSFDEFVFESNKYYSVMEAEGSEASDVDFVKKLLSGTIKLNDKDQKDFAKVIDSLDNTRFPSPLATELKDNLTAFGDWLTGNTIDSFKSGFIGPDKVGESYRWLVNGSVRARNLNWMSGGAEWENDSTPSESGAAQIDSEPQMVPLTSLLRNLFAYNMYILGYYYAGEDKKSIRKNLNAGSKKKGKGTEAVYPFLTIDEGSLDGDVIKIVPFNPWTDKSNGGSNPSGDLASALSGAEGGAVIPVWSLSSLVKDGGKELSKDMYEEVIKPNPGEQTVTVKDLAYNSSGTTFFEENEVKISSDGMAALKAMVSGFHSIDKIVVNGGASSKPTSREGGNEKLAKDRMEAGLGALNTLKEEKTEQLKNAEIVKGEAKVQDAASNESDPANQQVSFIISGKIRKVNYEEAKEIKITKVDVKKADKVIFSKSYLGIGFNFA